MMKKNSYNFEYGIEKIGNTIEFTIFKQEQRLVYKARRGEQGYFQIGNINIYDGNIQLDCSRDSVFLHSDGVYGSPVRRVCSVHLSLGNVSEKSKALIEFQKISQKL